jgi:hypothetical protein
MGKKTPPDPRADPEADRQIFEYLQYVLQDLDTVRLTGRWRSGVIHRGNTKNPNKQYGKAEDHILLDLDEEAANAGSVTVWVPAWKHTGPKLKTLAWIMSMAEFGDRAQTLNLNLGTDVIGRAKVAQANQGIGFARYMRNRIKKHLSSATSPYGVDTPEFFFWVEAQTEQKAHLHGAIVLPEHPDAPKLKLAIRDALKAAGGEWNSDEDENQLDIDAMWGPAGWAGYISKWPHLSRLQLQDNNTVAATRGIRARARDWYSAARETGDPIKG